jgi:mRNA interferase RelE/StbE
MIFPKPSSFALLSAILARANTPVRTRRTSAPPSIFPAQKAGRFAQDQIDAYSRLLVDPDQMRPEPSQRLQHPRVSAARLTGHKARCKIELRSVGYRLVYELRDNILLVIVVAVGKRARNAVYRMEAKRTVNAPDSGRKSEGGIGGNPFPSPLA